MLYKKSILQYDPETIGMIDVIPLNKPTLPGYMRDLQLLVNPIQIEYIIKTASKKEGDGETFDLKAEIEKYPDSLFVKCFAIKADEINDNGDLFSRGELKKAYRTFVGKPVFTNHENNDINKARGTIVHSWWDEDRDGISLIARVDAIAYPALARGIKQKYVIGTSMGANVKYSLCSCCHNYAETQDQYCSCIKERKTRFIEAKRQKCRYHEHGTEEHCPLCGSSKKEIKSFAYSGKVFEHNYGVHFIENSFVVNPAFHTCGVTEVIDPSEWLKKVALISQSLPSLMKVASTQSIMCAGDSCIPVITADQCQNITTALDFLNQSKPLFEKRAGKKEVDDLNQALTLLSGVSKSMLEQRAQLDLEFLSDLVKVLADLQTVTDELNEQGYGRLPSPGEAANPEMGATQPPTPNSEGTIVNSVPGINSAPETPQPVNPSPAGTSNVFTGQAGPVGSVTSPTASKKIHLFKKSELPQQKLMPFQFQLRKNR